jgi:hypothetical protein
MRLKKGLALREQARRYGVSLEGLPDKGHTEDPSGGVSGSGKWDAFNDPEIQRRVMEFQRHRRDARLWIVAVAAALFSALSAAAAWYVAFRK